jgi:predicted SAM-dependent methyltransferase
MQRPTDCPLRTVDPAASVTEKIINLQESSAPVNGDMKSAMKQLLKRSSFIVELVRGARAFVIDVRKLSSFIVRGPKIKRYLRANPVRKLQLGTSDSVISGWLNTDLLPTSSDVVYLDATRRFPFKDNTFDYVYSEHMIEHIEYDSALFMLRECFRVLKPGGKIRMSTPDLRILAGLLSSERTAAQSFYIDWMATRFLPDATSCREVFVINNAFRAWGHQFLYDRETIEMTMKNVGFQNIRYYQPGVSDDENLRGIESHGSVMGCEEINQFEAFAVEADVPALKEQSREVVATLKSGISSKTVSPERQTIAGAR